MHAYAVIPRSDDGGDGRAVIGPFVTDNCIAYSLCSYSIIFYKAEVSAQRGIDLAIELTD